MIRKTYLTLIILLFLSSGFSQNYDMSTTTVSTCGGFFFDSGGNANYGNNEDYIMTFCPSTAGDQIKMIFTNFNLQNNNDYMYIFDGADTTAPQLTVATGLGLANSPGTIQATSANLSGCITVWFT